MFLESSLHCIFLNNNIYKTEITIHALVVLCGRFHYLSCYIKNKWFVKVKITKLPELREWMGNLLIKDFSVNGRRVKAEVELLQH